MTFHCNARYFLLTYSQCGDLDPEEVSKHIEQLRGECVVARETHADGGTHLHSFVDFGRKFRSRRTSVFDVGGCHPNVSATHSTPRAGFDYACKDGVIVAGRLERPSAGARPKQNNRWNDIVAAQDRDEFFKLVLEHDPRTLCTSFTQLTKFADWRFRKDPKPYEHPSTLAFDLRRFPELERWTLSSLQYHGECK